MCIRDRPHIEEPTGLNVAFADGHSRFISRPRMEEWGIGAIYARKANDWFVALFWEWLEGSSTTLEEQYQLP